MLLKSILISFLLLFLEAINNNLFAHSAVQENKKYTFIFDFDATMYTTKSKGEKEDSTYLQKLYESVVSRTPNLTSDEIENFALKNIFLIKDVNGIPKIINKINKKFNIHFIQEDLNYAIESIKTQETKGLRSAIQDLIKDGHQVLIIGGATMGCGIIPVFAENFNIPKNQIYSGYFKDFSTNEMRHSLKTVHKYYNCENLKTKTPDSHKKSDLIKELKAKKIITGSKIIHIGDGHNDLEVQKAKVVNHFIGFGLNKVSKKVKEEAEFFVSNIDEFNQILNKIIYE